MRQELQKVPPASGLRGRDSSDIKRTGEKKPFMKKNPYIAGNPVGGGSAFIGRADVLQDVLKVLKNPNDNGMVLYGQRRIGKTSVLRELETALPPAGPFSPVYFDLQDKAAHPLDRVLKDITNSILYGLNIVSEKSFDGDFEQGFKNDVLPYVLSNIPEHNILVLLLDEFDVLDTPSKDQAASALFPYLRELMGQNNPRLKFIFVIGRRPEDLSNMSLSLFKGMKARHVSLLSRDDTWNLVRLAEKNGSLKWSDTGAAEIQCLTGGHPFLTQQLCQVIWDNLYDEDPEDPPIVRPEDVKAAVSEALKSARNSLEWLWEGLGPAERVVASALAQAGPGLISQEKLEKLLQDSGVRILIRELQNAPMILQEWDLLRLEEGRYRFRVEMMRQWIAAQKPLSRVQDEIDKINPLADDLFRVANGFYMMRKLDDAIPMLQQAIGVNPNHLKANQMLAEILLAKGNDDEALKHLETLYEFNPPAARPRLIQVLLRQVKKEKNEDKRLVIYERILGIDPGQGEAVEGKRKIYEKKGDIALKNNELDKALEAYNMANVTEKKEKIKKRLHVQKLYHQAVGLVKEIPENALKLLAEVIQHEPFFEGASRYIHLAATGEDVQMLREEKIGLEQRIKALEKEKSGLEDLTRQLGEEKQKLIQEVQKLKPPDPAREKQKNGSDNKTDKQKNIPDKPKEIKRDDRFIAYDNGTVLDTKTNLMWAAKDNGKDINWEGAKKYCESYRGGGYSDWRMPAIAELKGLFKTGPGYAPQCGSDTVYVTNLITLTGYWVWSSESKTENGVSGAGLVHFYVGDSGFGDPVSPVYSRALPVRGGN
jgi:tetratricopeptide (TPR) repeat protein